MDHFQDQSGLSIFHQFSAASFAYYSVPIDNVQIGYKMNNASNDSSRALNPMLLYYKWKSVAAQTLGRQAHCSNDNPVKEWNDIKFEKMVNAVAQF